MSDQGLRETDVCTKFQCQEFDGDITIKRPKLVLRGIYWCCPKCHAGYGENPHPNCPKSRPE